MATKLGIYNQALALLGQRELATVTDAVEPRRVFDTHYDAALAHCLEQGVWNFAIRSSTETSDATVTSGGYSYSFTKPTDWVRTAMIATDAQFTNPLLNYADEAGVIRADVTTLYLKYVSNHATLGGGLLTAWTQLYSDYVVAHLAMRTCIRITQSDAMLERIEKIEKRARAAARAKDAMNDPPGFTPRGAWVMSRGGSSRYDQRRDNS